MIMRTIILAFKLIKKRKNSIVFMTLELVVSAIVLIALIGQLTVDAHIQDITKIIQNSNCVFFTPYDYYTPDFFVQNFMNKKWKNKVSVESIHDLVCKKQNGGEIQALGYGDKLLEGMNIPMESGKWFSPEEMGTEYIPVVSVGKQWKVGDNIEFRDGTKGKVIGRVKLEQAMLNLSQGSSDGGESFSQFVGYYKKSLIIIPYKSKNYMNPSKEIFQMDVKEDSNLIYFQENINKKELKKELRKYGNVSFVPEMKNNYEEEKMQTMIVDGVEVFVFSILTAVGILGINGIESIKNERTYTILYMLGLDAKRCMIVEGINTCIVFLISLGIIYGGYDYIIAYALGDGVNIQRVPVILLTFMYLFIIYVCTANGSIRKAGRCNIIDLYKRGNE